MEERERVKLDSGEAAPGPGSSTATLGPEAAEETDVCSERFDPLRALYSPAVPLPFPGIKCFNNVAEYESFLKGGRGRSKPENAEKKRRKAARGQPDPERIDRLRRLMVNNPVGQAEEGGSGGGQSQSRRKRQKAPRNVLTRMPLCKGSPLGELYRCVEEKIRVRVYIRTFKGLRGVCSGFVVAFDKFWNMAMVDVDETYREPLLGEELYHEKALTVSRLFEKLKLQESAEGDPPVKKQDAREEDIDAPPADPKTPQRSSSAPSESDESKTSQGVQTKAKARDPPTGQRKVSRRHGKVHKRHVNQLFIRGESVILVNPQPL